MKRAELVTFEQDPQMVYVIQLGRRRYAGRVLDTTVTGETSDPLVVRSGRVKVEYEDIQLGEWIIGDVSLNQIHPMTERIAEALEKRRAQKQAAEEKEANHDKIGRSARQRLLDLGVPADWVATFSEDEDDDDEDDDDRSDLVGNILVVVGYYNGRVDVEMSLVTFEALVKHLRQGAFDGEEG